MKNTLLILAAMFIFNIRVNGQCNNLTASFTYTQGTNGSITFTSTTTGGTLPHSYFWNVGNYNFLSDSASFTYTFPANYTYNVCLTVSDSVIRFCQSSSCQQVIVTNSQTYNCAGVTAITATPNGTSTDFTFSQSTSVSRELFFGDGGAEIVSGNTAQHNYALNGTYTVKAYAYNYLNGFSIYCDSTIQTLTVNNIPCKANFTVAVDTLWPNPGKSFILENSSTDFTQVKWYLNGSILNTVYDSVYTGILAPGTYNICLVINGPNGCSDSICKIDSLVYIGPCTGVTSTYSALSSPCDAYQFTTTNSSSLISIQWDQDGTPFSSQPNPSLTLSFADPLHDIPSHTITVTDTGTKCKATQTFEILNPADFNIYSYDSLTHTWYVIPNGNNNTASEIWDFGDGTTSTQPYPTHTYAVGGYYNLCHHVVLTNGCTYDFCYNNNFFRQDGSNYIISIVVEQSVATAIKPSNPSTAFHCYPNPVSDVFNIVSDATLSTETTLTIFNSLGQLVKTENVSPDGLRFVINAKLLPVGVYYYNVMDNHSILNRGKIVVVR